jgi:hypothetical protein
MSYASSLTEKSRGRVTRLVVVVLTLHNTIPWAGACCAGSGNQQLKTYGGNEREYGKGDESEVEAEVLQRETGEDGADHAADRLGRGEDAEQRVELSFAPGEVGGKGHNCNAVYASANAIECLEEEDHVGVVCQRVGQNTQRKRPEGDGHDWLSTQS